MMGGHLWKPIEDLPDDWPDLKFDALHSLASIWNEQAEKLKETETLKQFNQRLSREWAIETGIIENLYSIDRGTTQLLIEQGIEADLIPHGATDRAPELIVPLLKDQESVLEGLFDFVAQRRNLSTSYIKTLHQALTQNQESTLALNGLGRRVEVALLRGEWKRHPNNPTRPDGDVHEYCPPEQVASEMDRLIEMHQSHLQAGIAPEVEAAWLHHRFAQIHPFQDGNGRIARALASLVLLRAGWFPLVIHRDIREAYITALEKADAGDLKPLVDLFVAVEQKAFVQALSISESVIRSREPFRQIIDAATDRLRIRAEAHLQERRSVFQISAALEDLARERLTNIASDLNVELHRFNPLFSSRVDSSDLNTDFYFRKQIIEVAKELGYYADTRTYRAWVRMRIFEERTVEIAISFHALGVEFLGVMAVSAFLEYRDRGEEEKVDIEGPYVLCNDVFQFSYHEPGEVVARRFEPWLQDVMISGLDQWRKQL